MIGKRKQIPEGQPCDHPGCLGHVLHPCEGCGRIGGRATPPFYHRVECCGNCWTFDVAGSVCRFTKPPLRVGRDYKCDVYKPEGHDR